MSRSFFKNPSSETDVSFNKCFIMLFQVFIHAQIDRGGGVRDQGVRIPLPGNFKLFKCY